MDVEPPAPPAEEEFEIKKSKKEKMTNIKYDANLFDAFNEKEIHDMFSIESTMVNQDRIITETYERKNELESMVYTWKEKLVGSHQAYVKPEQIPEILAFLEQMGNWLYDEGASANRGTYIEKIDETHKKVGAIQKRYTAFETIAYEITTLISCLNSNFELANSLVHSQLI